MASTSGIGTFRECRIDELTKPGDWLWWVDGGEWNDECRREDWPLEGFDWELERTSVLP